MNFDTLFTDPGGRTGRETFLAALVVLLAAVEFYLILVTGRTAQFAMVVLLFPGTILLARRLRDMGQSAWLALVPSALLAVTAWFKLYNPEAVAGGTLALVAIAVAALFALWGLLGEAGEGAADAEV
jgi:uncharacterized membrane protein YhaH (DUF805 family)